jgi:Zn2+/Cd2+-exporting ATPase
LLPSGFQALRDKTVNIAQLSLRYRVEGMDCASCARKVETALTRVPGISDIAVNTTTETLRLKAADGASEHVEEVVRGLGYEITPIEEH